ncbi:MAG: PliI family lysozyme inhibitor of I-type lysozyme, partial [Bacteroidales bacterium]|nr:PliI family lysozyme inhibitor of I-type lysozyme [Bacteroidales bacterium]
LIGCNNRNKQTNNSPEPAIELAGDYVSSEYNKRNEGYDWVAVLVTKTNDSIVHISVRSRADKKKPTCTYDTDATKINNTTFKAETDGKNIVFSFKDNVLNITTEKEDDKDILSYFCSGGGSLLGDYTKLKEALDKVQIDPTIFQKTLSLQGILFFISSTGEGSIQQLSIKPNGLKIDNSKISMEIDGYITNAEIEDLNSDGYPEILIYTVSAGSGSYGNVIGYSVNNGKSLSQIYFPNIADNPKANKGYMGHDEFAVVETTLIQRFQIYNEGDTNANPTGNIRQIQYKLKEGEASRQFVIDKILEYPAK